MGTLKHRLALEWKAEPRHGSACKSSCSTVRGGHWGWLQGAADWEPGVPGELGRLQTNPAPVGNGCPGRLSSWSNCKTLVCWKQTARGQCPLPNSHRLSKGKCRKLLGAERANINSTRTARRRVPLSQSAKSPPGTGRPANTTCEPEAAITRSQLHLAADPYDSCSNGPVPQALASDQHQENREAGVSPGCFPPPFSVPSRSWRLVACPSPHHTPSSDGPSQDGGQTLLKLAKGKRVSSNS